MLASALLLVCAPSAFAATTINVNTTADSSSALDNACSLREAIAAANTDTASGVLPNECAAGSGTDTIDFPTVANTRFDGTLANSTITIGSQLVVSQPVTIDGSNCGTVVAPKPCVEVHDSSATNIGLNIAGPDGVQIHGLAITGTATAISVNSGADSAVITGSWFGERLDGTLSGNGSSVVVINSASPAIGGVTPGVRNVFASQESPGSAITLQGAPSGTVQGNYIGTLANGNASASAGGGGVEVFNSNGVTIGGTASNAGTCDGPCNLIGNFLGRGISLDNGSPSPSSGTIIRGNFIGLGLDGSTDFGNDGRGINVDNAPSTTIGGSAAGQRNYVANSGDVGVFVGPSGSNFTATNNYIGLSVNGTTAMPNTRGLAQVGGILSAGSGGTITNNRFGGNGLKIMSTTTVTGNVIGVGPSGQDLGPSGEPGLVVAGAGNTIGDAGAGEANTIGNVKMAPAAVYLDSEGTNVDNNTVQGNFIGTTSTGVPAPNSGAGILIGGSNADSNNTIGSPDGDLTPPNVISNSAGDAISQVQAGDGNQYLRNLGRNNGSGPGDLFIDIANNGPGNPNNNQTNNGILAPSGLTVNANSISGSTGSVRNGATVYVYTTFTGRGDLREFLGKATANGSGAWSFNYPSSLPNGQCVTANQTDTNVNPNSSELATPVAIGGGSCVTPPFTSIDSGPSQGSTITSPISQFTFTSPEGGATFECKVDGGSFDTCTSPFTTFPLGDGPHTVQVRAKTTTDPALGTDVGQAVSRSFTIDTTGPIVTIESGPAEGSTIGVNTASFGFSSNEPGSTFECALEGSGFTPCSSPYDLSSLNEGSRTILIRATDAVGNVGPNAVRTFIVDLPTPPDVTAPNTKIGKVKVNGNTATVNFSATDATAAGASGASGISFQCKLDKGKFRPCKSPKKYRRLKEGRHTVKIKAIDAAGNIDSTPATKRFRI